MKNLTAEEQIVLHFPYHCGDTIVLVNIVKRLCAENKRLQDEYAEVESIFPRVRLLCGMESRGGDKFELGEIVRISGSFQSGNIDEINITDGTRKINNVDRARTQPVTVVDDKIMEEVKRNAKEFRDRYFAAHGATL